MNILYLCVLISCSMSITASILIFICYLFISELKYTNSKRYFLVLQLIDTLSCISVILNPNHSDSICKYQASLQQFFGLLVIFWNVIISSSLYYEEPLYKGTKQFPYIYSSIIAIIISAFIALITLFYNLVEKNLDFCSVKAKGDYWYCIYIFYYIPFVLCSVWNVFCLVKVVRFRKSRLMEETCRNKNRLLVLYPGILIFCNIFPLISRILSSANVEQGIFQGFAFFMTFFHGFLNGILAGLAAKIDKKLHLDSALNEQVLFEYSLALKADSIQALSKYSQ